MKQVLYVTKYALTTGIMKVNAEIVEGCTKPGTMIVVDRGMYFHKPHWYNTLEEAHARVEKMIELKLKSTHKALKKLEETTTSTVKMDDRTLKG